MQPLVRMRAVATAATVCGGRWPTGYGAAAATGARRHNLRWSMTRPSTRSLPTTMETMMAAAASAVAQRTGRTCPHGARSPIDTSVRRHSLFLRHLRNAPLLKKEGPARLDLPSRCHMAAVGQAGSRGPLAVCTCTMRQSFMRAPPLSLCGVLSPATAPADHRGPPSQGPLLWNRYFLARST
eukprot:6820203-Prymnesium_polylepis.1